MSRNHKRFKPVVPVNYHDEDGTIEREEVDLSELFVMDHRVNAQLDPNENTENLQLQEEDDRSDVDFDVENNEEQESSSLYYKKVERKQKAWENLRDLAIKRTFQFAGKRIKNNKCIHCGTDGKFRCTDCGPMATFCENCMLKVHTNMNIFHSVEILKDGIYWPHRLSTLLVCDCPCETVHHIRSVSAVSVKGVFFNINVQFCSCCPESVQLLQFGLWGGTPTKPRTCFSIELLELVHAMQMECQASLKSICQAFEIFNEDKIVVGLHKMYPIIIDAFEEYRLYRHKLSTLQCISPEVDEGNICPACPKTDGMIFESLDALFIGRRKKAGRSTGSPLFGELMFYSQQHVDQFVAQYATSPSNTRACHDFLAGSAVRSMNRYKALDETAIFGRGCRHEFPKKMLNLKHGERLAYAVYVLQKLEEDNADNPGLKIHILYDIACMLVKHLQNLDEEPLLGTFQFAIPIFHCYGHNGQCQLHYSPRRKEGFGLTDGEMLERVWAYIRRFGKMTKEMRPSHRVDVLTDALLHYGMKTKKKLGGLLVKRLKKAIDIEKAAKCDIEKLLQCFSSSNIAIEDIRLWINEEMNNLGNEVENDQQPWQCIYVIYLDLYSDLYDRWSCCTDPNQLTIRFHQMKKIDNKLQTIEQENSIVARWKPSDEKYKDGKREVITRKTKLQLSKIKKKVIERWFLLSLKSKYSDGQALAARISKQINRITKDLKKEVKSFNEEQGSPFCDFQSVLTFDAIKDPDGEFWCTSTDVTGSDECFVPLSVKRKAIDLCNLLDRSREEQNLVKEEMGNTWRYFSMQHSVVAAFLTALTNHERVLDIERGEELFARKKLLHLESTLLALQNQFSTYIGIEDPHYFVLERGDLADSDVDQTFVDDDEEETIIVCEDIYDSENELDEGEYDSTDDEE